jgi:hypothetical protein
VKAVLSAAAATAVVPARQPEPLTVSTLTSILSEGADDASADAPGDEAGATGARSAATTPLATKMPDMALLFSNLEKERR